MSKLVQFCAGGSVFGWRWLTSLRQWSCFCHNEPKQAKVPSTCLHVSSPEPHRSFTWHGGTHKITIPEDKKPATLSHCWVRPTTINSKTPLRGKLRRRPAGDGKEGKTPPRNAASGKPYQRGQHLVCVLSPSIPPAKAENFFCNSDSKKK